MILCVHYSRILINAQHSAIKLPFQVHPQRIEHTQRDRDVGTNHQNERKKKTFKSQY